MDEKKPIKDQKLQVDGPRDQEAGDDLCGRLLGVFWRPRSFGIGHDRSFDVFGIQIRERAFRFVYLASDWGGVATILLEYMLLEGYNVHATEAVTTVHLKLHSFTRKRFRAFFPFLNDQDLTIITFSVLNSANSKADLATLFNLFERFHIKKDGQIRITTSENGHSDKESDVRSSQELLNKLSDAKELDLNTIETSSECSSFSESALSTLSRHSDVTPKPESQTPRNIARPPSPNSSERPPLVEERELYPPPATSLGPTRTCFSAFNVFVGSHRFKLRNLRVYSSGFLLHQMSHADTLMPILRDLWIPHRLIESASWCSSTTKSVKSLILVPRLEAVVHIRRLLGIIAHNQYPYPSQTGFQVRDLLFDLDMIKNNAIPVRMAVIKSFVDQVTELDASELQGKHDRIATFNREWEDTDLPEEMDTDLRLLDDSSEYAGEFLISLKRPDLILFGRVPSGASSVQVRQEGFRICHILPRLEGKEDLRGGGDQVKRTYRTSVANGEPHLIIRFPDVRSMDLCLRDDGERSVGVAVVIRVASKVADDFERRFLRPIGHVPTSEDEAYRTTIVFLLTRTSRARMETLRSHFLRSAASSGSGGGGKKLRPSVEMISPSELYNRVLKRLLRATHT